MTNEQAIKSIQGLKYCLRSCLPKDKAEALDIAVKALSCSESPNRSDLIRRQDAIEALDKRFDDVPMELTVEILQLRRDLRERIQSAQPDNRLAKIADLVEGTIDHFDLDDAMDLLYQIKEVLK